MTPNEYGSITQAHTIKKTQAWLELKQAEE